VFQSLSDGCIIVATDKNGEGKHIMAQFKLNQVDKLEIWTLEDNYIDVASLDNSAILARAIPVKDMQLKNSILAEHGFSAVITTTTKDKPRTMLFDFGFSEDVVVRNAAALGVDLTKVEVAALSHGHIDHFGGFAEVAKRIDKKDLELILHPNAFRQNRYTEPIQGIQIGLPALEKEKVEASGFKITQAKEPLLLLDGDILFLGEIPRRTSFEKGLPYAFYEEKGQQTWDPTEDDTAVVMNLGSKGLVVLSGCAHSGIINTVKYAREITGINAVHVIMGGFHLTGPAFEPIIDDTVESLQQIGPEYVIPTHCTGRKAILAIEKAMPSQFLMNMSGTKLTFVA
jgi:7,8-dihydropterin-6-yl-methyl-4-(beta-D-ribofuranosyl)aminobenzene 5'-phosphate synthase